MMDTEWEEGRKKHNRGEGGERGRREGHDTAMGTHVWSLLQTMQLFATSVLLFCFHMAFNLAVWTTDRC